MSGIYIPGMKMPKACFFCVFHSFEYCDLLRQTMQDVFQRDSRCPLIAVPDHGRLIDANRLQMRTEYVRMAEHYIKSEHVVLYDDVENSPTIIPADKED